MAVNRHVWIVEILINGSWMETVGCALTRKDALKTLRFWRSNNPTDKFRLHKYTRA